MELQELLELNIFLLIKAITEEYDEPTKEELEKMWNEFRNTIPRTTARMKISHEDLSDEIAELNVDTDEITELTI